MLVHLVAVDPLEGADPVEAYATVRSELAGHGSGLGALPEILVVSKRDLAPEAEVDELVARFRERVGESAAAVMAVSSATGAGLDELRRAIFASVPAAEPEGATAPGAVAEPEFEAEHIVYRPEGDGGFDVVREGDAFRVTGRGVEMLFARHDVSNLEALAYLEQRLREIGVIAALERAGSESGDEVRIGEEEFELHPG